MLLSLLILVAHHCQPRPKPAPPVKLYIYPKLIYPQPGEVIIKHGPVVHLPEDGQSRNPFEWAKDNRSIA